MLRQTSVLGLGLALVLVAGAQGSRSLKGPGVIRITDVEVSRSHVDVGKKGLSPGDQDFRRYNLFNTRITKKPIGRGDTMCTYTGEKSSQCTGTYVLTHGEIVAGGVIGSKLLYTQAVLGGTGIYDNVGGTLTVTSLGGKPPKELLLFRLTAPG